MIQSCVASEHTDRACDLGKHQTAHLHFHSRKRGHVAALLMGARTEAMAKGHCLDLLAIRVLISVTDVRLYFIYC